MTFELVTWVWNQNGRVIHVRIIYSKTFKTTICWSGAIEPSKLFIEKIMRDTGLRKVCKNYQGYSFSNMKGAQSWREAWSLSKKKADRQEIRTTNTVADPPQAPASNKHPGSAPRPPSLPLSVLRNRHLCKYVWEQLINFSAQITIALTVLKHLT